MNITLNQYLNAVEKYGNMKMAAASFGMNHTDFRSSLAGYLKRAGMDTTWVKVRECVAYINKYTDKPFSNMRVMIANPYNHMGVAVCHVDDKLICVRQDKATGTLVGVYDKNSDPDDMRTDLYWYIKNYMEAKQ